MRPAISGCAYSAVPTAWISGKDARPGFPFRPRCCGVAVGNWPLFQNALLTLGLEGGVVSPSRTAEQMHAFINRSNRRDVYLEILHGEFQNLVRFLLWSFLCPIEIIMNDGGIGVVAIRRQQRPENPRNAGQIGHEA